MKVLNFAIALTGDRAIDKVRVLTVSFGFKALRVVDIDVIMLNDLGVHLENLIFHDGVMEFTSGVIETYEAAIANKLYTLLDIEGADLYVADWTGKISVFNENQDLSTVRFTNAERDRNGKLKFSEGELVSTASIVEVVRVEAPEKQREEKEHCENDTQLAVYIPIVDVDNQEYSTEVLGQAVRHIDMGLKPDVVRDTQYVFTRNKSMGNFVKAMEFMRYINQGELEGMAGKIKTVKAKLCKIFGENRVEIVIGNKKME